MSDKSQLIICKASAGSGKTFTLVKQYLTMAFNAPKEQIPDRFRHILAITFTNKAANEMKTRIVSELNNIVAQGAESDMCRLICQELSLKPASLQEYAGILKSAILHNYSDLSVCTIDSFMHRVVKTFARDLEKPVNFDLLTDNSDLVKEAVDALMAKAGTEGEEELTELLCDYAEFEMAEGKSYNISKDLAELAEELFKEETPAHLCRLTQKTPGEFLALKKDYMEKNKVLQDGLVKVGKTALGLIKAAKLKTEDFHQKGNGIGAFFSKAAENEMPDPIKTAFTDFVHKGKKTSSRDPQVIAAIDSIYDDLCNQYNQYTTLYISEIADYNTRKKLLTALYKMAVMDKMNQLIEEYSDENEVMHISEFNRLISDVVEKEPAPFIYERLGSRYHNYLIDEFQDTSKKQWQNLVPLLENGISDGYTSLVVGDAKQAIYRFRGGDVEQFASLPLVDSPLHGALFSQPGIANPLTLDTNYRTRQEVVEFNNRFFEWLTSTQTENGLLKKIYIGDDVRPALHQNHIKEGGYVEAEFFSKEDGKAAIYERIFETIRHQVADLGYHYKDIFILGRANQALNDIAAYLSQKEINGSKIPMASNEAFSLSRSQVALVLRHLMGYLIDMTSRNDAYQVMDLLYRLGVVSANHADEFAKTREVDLQDMLSREGLDINCEKLLALGLYDCYEEAIRELRLDGLEPAYTGTLLNKVARYASNHRQDLVEWIEWYDKNLPKISTQTNGDADAIQLMTIHKSKGLEAPIVIIPELNQFGHPEPLWVDIENEELNLGTCLIQLSKDESTLLSKHYTAEQLQKEMDETNTQYVALTRPKDKLFLFCEEPYNRAVGRNQILLQSFVDYETEIGRCQQEDHRYFYGTDHASLSKSEPNTAKVEISTLSYPEWSSRIAIAEQSEKLFNPLANENIRLGVQMHEVLAGLRNWDETDLALKQYASRNHPSEEDLLRLESTLRRMLKDEDCRRFFNPNHKVLNEQSLIYQGEVLRPDRIVMTGDETWIIDFKTGQPNAKYPQQVLRYCKAISDMGYDKVRGFLLYLNADEVRVEEV